MDQRLIDDLTEVQRAHVGRTENGRGSLDWALEVLARAVIALALKREPESVATLSGELEEARRSSREALEAERERSAERMRGARHQIEALRSTVAQLQDRRAEQQRELAERTAQWRRIQPLIRALHAWEPAAQRDGLIPYESELVDAFEAWQKAEAAALNDEATEAVSPEVRVLDERRDIVEYLRRIGNTSSPGYRPVAMEEVASAIARGAHVRLAPLPENGPATSTPCDGEHAAPACTDSQCYRRETAAEVTAPGKRSAARALAGDGASRIHDLVSHVRQLAHGLYEMTGRHVVCRVVLESEAALRWTIGPANPLIAMTESGPVEVTALDDRPWAQVRESVRQADHTTASIDASNREREEVRRALNIPRDAGPNDVIAAINEYVGRHEQLKAALKTLAGAQ